MTQPPRQFIDWFDDGRFAYARGLTVSPTHLPQTISAMLDAGWELDHIFGEASAANIGFIFRKA